MLPQKRKYQVFGFDSNDKNELNSKLKEVVIQKNYFSENKNNVVNSDEEKDSDLSEGEFLSLPLEQPNVQKFIDGQEFKHKQYVINKIVIFNV